MPSSTAPVAPDIRKIAPQVLDDLWNKRDLAVIDEHFSPRVVTYVPLPGQPVIHGIPGLRDLASQMFTAMPDLSRTTHEVLAQGDKVLVRGMTVHREPPLIGGVDRRGVSTSASSRIREGEDGCD